MAHNNGITPKSPVNQFTPEGLHWRTDEEMRQAGLDPETGMPLAKADAMRAAGLNLHSGLPNKYRSTAASRKAALDNLDSWIASLQQGPDDTDPERIENSLRAGRQMAGLE